MRTVSSRLLCAALAMVASAACTDTDSATNLNPEGPPMIRQVRMLERYLDSAMIPRSRVVFAFGTHPLATPEEVHPVDTAVPINNELRVVIDELLVGNNLEEIACRATVDDDVYARVPLGTDPDDISRCSVANDVLPSTCPASDRHSVCICQRPSGCIRGSTTVPQGQPVGVADVNQDGSSDDTQFIAGAVGIRCGAISGAIDVPIDLQNSYWTPSGDQNRPAMGGFDVLGPAIVLSPSAPLPTSTRCSLVFAAEVVDKQGIAVCAPAGGAVDAGCTPGDVSAFSFGVEPLSIRPTSPAPGAPSAPRTGPLQLSINVPVNVASLANIQITPAPPGTVAVTSPMNASIRIDFGTPLAPATAYTVTVPTTVTDTYGQPLPQALTYTFTTGA